MRLIDADLLVKTLFEVAGDNPAKYFYFSEAVGIIWKQPTVEAGSKWIPCSESIPEKSGHYLVQHTREYCEDEMVVAYYSVEERKSDKNYEFECETFHDIKEFIAWQPLPDIYKGEQYARRRNLTYHKRTDQT